MVGKATFSFALVASQYNQDYVQGLVTHAHQELNELEPGVPPRWSGRRVL